MKGIIFTEFLELVEQKFGLEMVDTLIAENESKTQGVYTATGNYSHKELVAMVVTLSKKSGIEIPALLKVYGEYLFGVLVKMYGTLLQKAEDGFDLLINIEEYIHVEVKKMYPDAVTPGFETKRINENTLEMLYSSHRSMAAVGEGLIQGCAKHYNETYEVSTQDLNEDGTKVLITIVRH